MTTNRKKSPLEHLFDSEIQKAAKTLISAVREILDDDHAQPAETPHTAPTGNDRVRQALAVTENEIIARLNTSRITGHLSEFTYTRAATAVTESFVQASKNIDSGKL